ncbi:HNH endonuclease [Streptomyces halstedii]|uniref:HNH endonuclease n=1 Tax=Streptomyces halstedii TaxID=1944 RepID=UPI003814F962
MKLLTSEIQDRILRKTAPNGACLEWQGATARGYGQMKIGGKEGSYVRVHRIACEARNGPPTESKSHALHSCNNKLCVNPWHLYWGDNADNQRDRQLAGTARGGRPWVTHCPQGHEYNEENTYLTTKGRHCKECRREAVRRYRSKKKVQP